MKFKELLYEVMLEHRNDFTSPEGLGLMDSEIKNIHSNWMKTFRKICKDNDINLAMNEGQKGFTDDEVVKFAKLFTATMVRGCLEDLHSGTIPTSKTGDHTDVYIVSPYGQIPWNELSRISQDEMKALMKNVVKNVYASFMFFFYRKIDRGIINKLFETLETLSGSALDWDDPR